MDGTPRMIHDGQPGYIFHSSNNLKGSQFGASLKYCSVFVLVNCFFATSIIKCYQACQNNSTEVVFKSSVILNLVASSCTSTFINVEVHEEATKLSITLLLNTTSVELLSKIARP